MGYWKSFSTWAAPRMGPSVSFVLVQLGVLSFLLFIFLYDRLVMYYSWNPKKLVRSRWLDINQFFFARVFMDRHGVELHKLGKKDEAYMSHLLDRTSLVNWKDLLCGCRGNSSCGIQRVVPSGQDSFILPARVANHSAGFTSFCRPT